MDAEPSARVLVADDSPMILEMVRQVLEGAGIAVLTAPDGLAAMNMALREVPDLIISDVEMPEMTGLQLCRLLKGDPRTRSVPFVILSSHKEQYEQFWGRESGADDYLPKPFGPHVLLDRVRMLLARYPRPATPVAAPDTPATTRIEALERVNASLERRLFEQTVIHGVSTIAATASGERETARAVLERLARLVDFNVAALAFAAGGTSYILIRKPTHPAALQALHGELIAEIPQPEGGPPAPGLLSGAEYVSVRTGDTAPATAVQPLRASGSLVGTLGIARESGHEFEDPERSLLELIAGQAALVLENARLVEVERAHTQALETQNEELRRLNRTITDLIGTVTHDLRTPLSSVMGYLELAMEGCEAESETAEFVQIARRNAERMMRIINDLLDLSRLEARRTPVSPRSIRLLSVLSDVAITLKPTLDAKRQTYVDDAPRDLPPLMADPERLHQVLLNLLSNASKYSPEGTEIRVHARQEGEFVRIAVQDRGMGLTEEDLRQVFSKFFRAQRPEMTGITGTGLGLAIVKTIVELHGGEVFVESKVNEGSTFGFTLPTAGGATAAAGATRPEGA